MPHEGLREAVAVTGPGQELSAWEEAGLFKEQGEAECRPLEYFEQKGEVTGLMV